MKKVELINHDKFGVTQEAPFARGPGQWPTPPMPNPASR